MSPADTPRELFTLAERDYEAARILAHAENPQTDVAGFHLEQAAEKALKAWLLLKGIDYPRTHDLNVMLGLLEDQGESVEIFWSLLVLNPFAVQFRYELADEPFTDFEQFAELTEELLAQVRSLLGP